MRKFIWRIGIFPIITGVVLLALTAFAVMYGERLNPFDGKSWSDFDSQDRASIARLDELLDRPLVATAPGCEIRSPNGELVNHRFQNVETAGDAEILLEAGSTINGNCFPEDDSD